MPAQIHNNGQRASYVTVDGKYVGWIHWYKGNRWVEYNWRLPHTDDWAHVLGLEKPLFTDPEEAMAYLLERIDGWNDRRN